MQQPLHVPVLADELIELVSPGTGDTVIDCTFGLGGHARLIADRIGASGSYIGLDRDGLAEQAFSKFESETDCDTRFVRGPFSNGLENLKEEDVEAEVIIFDLGISSPQIDDPERGFSYMADAELDMRMDRSAELTAFEIVNEWRVEDIRRILREYGEERFGGRIAVAIDRRRNQKPITTTAELVEIISRAVPASARYSGGHPAKRSFQALRIAVNGELDQVDTALPLAWGLLKQNGRLGVISFHSLEDRRVKNFMLDKARGCICPPDFPVCVCGREPEAKLASRRAISASEQELARNSRAASARLRVATKIGKAS